MMADRTLRRERYRISEVLRRVLEDSDPDDVESDEPSCDKADRDELVDETAPHDEQSNDGDSDDSDINDEVSNSDNIDGDDDSDDLNEDVYACRNSAEKWSTAVPVAGQTKQQNVVKGRPGPTGYAKQRVNSDDPVDSFHVFFNDNMLDLIVRFTNLQGGCTKPNWKDVSRDEMKAFIGVVILRGV